MAVRGTVASASSSSTQTVTVTPIGIQLNDIVLLSVCSFAGNTPTFPSGFAQVPGTSPAVNDGSAALYAFYKVATATEVAASTLSATGASFGGAINCVVLSGRNTSSPFTTQSQTNHAAAAFPVTFSITGLTAAAGDDVVVFVGQDLTAGTTAATLSYTPSGGFTNGTLGNDTVDTNAEWLASSVSTNVSAGATGTIAGSIAVTSGAGPGQTGYLAQVISIASGALPAISDGTTASGTVVSTGTGGSALPAFTVGQCVHVLLMAQTASALTEGGPSDGSNTYTHIQTADNHATRGFIFDRWFSIITTPLATPVITTTWSGTAKLAIAAAVLPNILTTNPISPGCVQQSSQTAPSGTDGQTSGPTTSANPLVPVTVAGWGFSVAETAAPVAGTGFTSIGTAWGALGGACLTYETKQSSFGQQQTATFTPVAGDAYTFVDVFNNLGSGPVPVPSPGPMPRRIFILP